MGIAASGQTTGVNSIIPFVHILLKQSSVHFSPQLHRFFLFRSLHSQVVVVAGIDVEEIAVDHFSVVVERLVMVVTAVEVVGGVDHIGAVVEAVVFIGVVGVKGKVVSLMVVAAVDGTAVSVIVVAFEVEGKGVVTVVLIVVSGVVTVKFGVE